MNSGKVKRENSLILLKNILMKTLTDVQVNIYLFGSWARNEEKRTSDIDIALQSDEEIPINKMVELRENIEESMLPYHVDIVDLSKASPNLVENVMREGIMWKDCTNGFKVRKGL
ncbi:putative nucleotidyltransferase [Virgibacillus halotolerans]|uniref:type VII toxin-antitoxin system MntA family adenylyltransferase antitoxin n=1 Tax=Virgibacillus halotolerans TaxID=1071053 RepID=UPI00195F8E65|nr:putative nucleotidyltransferase [Virgibacillus halotolerans]